MFRTLVLALAVLAPTSAFAGSARSLTGETVDLTAATHVVVFSVHDADARQVLHAAADAVDAGASIVLINRDAPSSVAAARAISRSAGIASQVVADASGQARRALGVADSGVYAVGSERLAHVAGPATLALAHVAAPHMDAVVASAE